MMCIIRHGLTKVDQAETCTIRHRLEKVRRLPLPDDRQSVPRVGETRIAPEPE
jgi:hypothetical protein